MTGFLKKSTSLILTFFIAFTTLHADEGMWLPHLLKELKEKQMKKMGMKISAEDIYSINRSSMKDAVVLFGRGCTGELISGEGLLLTNHHCGFGQIQKHSSLENDYLKNGFWAMNRSQELTNPGLTVTFIVSIEDVTEQILKGVTVQMDERTREGIISANSIEITVKAKGSTHYEPVIKPMYNGNEYYLFLTETFRDVRLVGAPPSSMGNFGRDSDNWSWPRHTADFALFRIYAGPDNKPADYSPENKPFKPRHFFPVSLKGVEENDFTMVYGFPARTNEYLSSFAVEQILNLSNPLKIALRAERLAVFNEFMNKDREVYIKYADKYASVSNAHKKWTGESRGLKKADALTKKRAYEEEFTRRVRSNASLNKYEGLFASLEKEYQQLAAYQPEIDLITEGVLGIELLRFANNFRALKHDSDAEQLQKLKEQARAHFKDYHRPIDEKIASILLGKYYRTSTMAIPAEFDYRLAPRTEQALIDAFVKDLFSTTLFADSMKLFPLLDAYDSLAFVRLNQDLAMLTSAHFYDFYRNVVFPPVNDINNRLIPLNRQYMQAQREVFKEKTFYPDANQTLRVTFGKAEGYFPYDGAKYFYYTTADGILEKNSSNHPDYEADPRLLDMIRRKDFGPYADKQGNLRTCFAASNHTTGGNSGSPVLNAQGHLIGTNFDRNWEGTMSDIHYDVNQVRNISVDVRYTLFVIDKFAGAGYLLNEMKIIR
ncbi:MAG: S46 family peptidase [Flavobacteriales bacterium]